MSWPVGGRAEKRRGSNISECVAGTASLGSRLYKQIVHKLNVLQLLNKVGRAVEVLLIGRVQTIVPTH